MFRFTLAAVFAASLLISPAIGQELMKEDFKVVDGSRWSTTLARLDARASINIFDDKYELELANGASLCTHKSFNDNVTVRIPWAYEPGSSDVNKQEVLTVALRSDGKLKDGVLLNGVALRIETVTGKVQVVQYLNGQSTVLKEQIVKVSEEGPAIPRGNGQNWFNLELTDNGKSIKVTSKELGGLKLKAAYDKSKFNENRLVFVNSPKPDDGECRSFFRTIVVEKTDNK